jgi:hypothetical protein
MNTRDAEAASCGMQRLLKCIEEAQHLFGQLLAGYAAEHGEMVREHYVRYLSFQYHLTKGVQRYFMEIAAHPDLARRRKLREFLFKFANEEELHYLVAAKDLEKLGRKPLAMPFDVELWHVYFKVISVERPFVRLGTATILETLSDGAARPWVKKLLTASFLGRENTKFLVLHQHETLPHGDQILDAIENGALEQRHWDDLVEGAHKGTIMYLRMAEWALRPDSLGAICDRDAFDISAEEDERIRHFEMSELEQPN